MKQHRLGRSGAMTYRYSRDSVERALTAHFGSLHWRVDGHGGYTVDTAIGPVTLRTLRETALFVIAAAEKGRRMDREDNDRRGG
jgi:hypothetical protein